MDALRQHHEGPSYGSLKPSTRKPGHGGSHGGRHDRGHGSYGGYGGHYGGHYGGYFGGYYGGYRGPYRYGYGYGPYRRPFSGYFGSYGFSWYPYFYLGYGYGGYGYSGYGGYGYGSYPRYRVEVYPRGALDLNIRPKDTGVYVDGYYVGTTGAHDGWPRHLWLEEGTHELIFYKDGYRTVVRNVLVRPDGMVRLQFRMEPGESIPPAELTRAGERERERASPARRAERREPRPYAGPYRDDAPPPRAASEPSTAPSATSPPGEPLDLRREAGRVHLAVSPAEASVYLDGRFIGLAGELGGLEEGLLVDPGEHRLEIFHPGHNVEERTLSVSAGEKVDLEIDLDG